MRPQRTQLRLSNMQVKDTELKDLAPLKNLNTFDLWGTLVADAGAKELAALKNLIWLDLRGTKVTKTGLKELLQALPKCRIP